LILINNFNSIFSGLANLNMKILWILLLCTICFAGKTFGDRKNESK